MSIQLYKESGWVDTIRGLESFGIVPEIRAQGTISKGYSGDVHPVSLDYFLVHTEAEPTKTTKTLPALLACYGQKQTELKMIHISIPSPSMSFKTGRFKYGKKSGVLCASDDNVSGRPLMDLKVSKDVTLYQGAVQHCQECPFNADGSCSETVLVLCTISAPDDMTPAPFGNMLFKMTLPRTARNPFFGDYALSMELAFSTVLRYGLDHRHFPQSMIPFKLSLVQRAGQYYNADKKSQVKTTYYVPQLSLDYDRLCDRLQRFSEQFGGRQLLAAPEQKQLRAPEKPDVTTQHNTPEWEPDGPDYMEDSAAADIDLVAPASMKRANLLTDKQIDLMRKIMKSHVFTDAERDRSEAMLVHSATDNQVFDGWVKWAQKTSAARKKAEAAANKAQPEADDEKAMQQPEIEAGRARVASSLGDKAVAMYDEAIQNQAWDTALDLIAQTY